MNTLSLLILVGELIGRMPIFFSIVVVLCIVRLFCTNDGVDKYDWYPFYGLINKGFATYKWAIIIGMASLFLAIFSPSSRTIYMIAASELGETVVTSPEVRDVVNDLRIIIKDMAGEALNGGE